MSEMVAAIAPLGVLVGVALGWNLRRVDSRCTECGCTLRCPSCAHRVIIESPQLHEVKR